MLEDCENGVGPVDHVEVVGGVPREPRVALNTRPEQSFIGIWAMEYRIWVSNRSLSNMVSRVNLDVSMAGKEDGKVLPLKKLSKVSWNFEICTIYIEFQCKCPKWWQKLAASIFSRLYSDCL